MTQKPLPKLKKRPRNKDADGSIMSGFAFGCLLQVVGMLALRMVRPDALFFIGIAQLAYMLPAVLLAVALKKPRAFKEGLVVCAAMIFILNGLCFGVAFLSLS